MAERPFSVLFPCTGNSARSIMAECALSRWGRGRFHAYCRGSHPTGQVHPMTLRVLQDLHSRTECPRSRSWKEFTSPRAPALDVVFTVCDSAAVEVCPVWPGQPITAHWGVEDPTAFRGPEDKTYKFFKRIHGHCDNRIKIFVSLPMASLDRPSLQERLDAIGQEMPRESTVAGA